MKNILVPTDFSGPATRAADIAIELAEKSGAKIHFLHIQVTPVPWVNLGKEMEKRYPDTLKEIGHAKDALNKLVKKAEGKGLNAQQFLVFDVGREEILKHIPLHHHDFVIMGSHGASGVKEMFIGSNAQKILRDCDVPVLIVKETSPWPVKNVIFASSFEEDVNNQFTLVKKFADITQSKIHLLYVNVPFSFEETDRSLDKMNSFKQSNHLDKSCTINIYNALNEERGILKFAESVKAELIAISTHGSAGFLGLMRKNITESLANHSKILLLGVNINQ